MPVVSLRDLPRAGAHRNRRMRRPGVLLQRLQAADRQGRERQAHAGCGRSARHAALRYPLPETESGFADAIDRSRHRLYRGRGPRDCRDCQASPVARAYGRRAFCECGGVARRASVGDYLARRRGCAVLWRHEERSAGRRGRGLLRSPPGGRLCISRQAGRAVGVEDAFHLGAVAGSARERCVAAQRASRQCDGATAACAHCRCAGRAHHVPDRIERRVRRASGAGHRGVARTRLALLHVHWCGRLPPDVLVDVQPETVEAFAADIRAACAQAV